MRSAARWLITGPMLTSVNGSPTVKSWAAFTKALVNLPKSSGSPPTKRCCCKQEFQITNYLLVCSATLVPDPPFSSKTRVCNSTPDVLYWLETQYPEEYAKAVPESLAGIQRDVYVSKLLDRLTEMLDKTPILNNKTKKVQHGLLGTLRGGFSHSQ